MAANKLITIGPIALTTTTSTLLVRPSATSPGQATGVTTTATNVQITIRHLRIVNTSATAGSVSLFVGAAAANTAGTEFLGSALAIAGNSFTEWFGALRLATGDTALALNGGANAATFTLEGEGEIGIS